MCKKFEFDSGLINKAEVNNPIEVMKFLICNHPKLESYMVDKYYRIDMGGYNATEDDLYNLELEAFMRLIQMPKTQERIKHTLETGKPLVN